MPGTLGRSQEGRFGWGPAAHEQVAAPFLSHFAGNGGQAVGAAALSSGKAFANQRIAWSLIDRPAIVAEGVLVGAPDAGAWVELHQAYQ